jgi:hypothetical protein
MHPPISEKDTHEEARGTGRALTPSRPRAREDAAPARVTLWDPVDFDSGSILASIFLGAIGFVAFVYGKKQGRVPQMVAGLLLMGFPYFVSNVLVMLAIGAVIVGGLWGAVRLGW